MSFESQFEQEMYRRTDALAKQLRNVTEALVQADANLSERIRAFEVPFESSESFLASLADEPSATQPSPPKRRRLWPTLGKL